MLNNENKTALISSVHCLDPEGLRGGTKYKIQSQDYGISVIMSELRTETCILIVLKTFEKWSFDLSVSCIYLHRSEVVFISQGASHIQVMMAQKSL